MKFIKKLLIIALVWGISSCDMTDLDLLDSPNAVTEDKASVNDLYNNIQLNFRNFYNGMWYWTAGFSRMVAQTSSYQYQNASSPQNFNGLWNTAYAGLLPDIDALINLAEPRGLDIHVGTAKVMKAYVLMSLVDMFGDVPYSQALQGTDVISPTPDPGDQVYAAAGTLLDEAISALTGSTASKPTNDIFYGGDPAKWVTAAKTFKLRAAVQTRLVNGNAASEINSLVSGGDLIDQASEDFQFNYGSQRDNPNSRHPFYNNSYEAADGDYMATYYMWLLRAEKLNAAGNPVVDPRIRFYFYRQVDGPSDNANDWSCHFSNFPDDIDAPAHYQAVDPRMPYCIPSSDGYWGRDHLNNEGIPPDGILRSVYGLYPGGGQFDDDSFLLTRQNGTSGGLGRGINPIMLSSFTYFLRAEAAITLKTNDDARDMLEKGIRASIDKVIGFKSLVPATMARQVDNRGVLTPVEDLYVPQQDDIDAYVDLVLGMYDAAASDDAKLDVVMKEYFIALWGNGLDAYNMYRRTGKPDNMAPSLEPGAGPFVRSFFYPADHVNLNSNASQKEITKQVFWDTNPADFVY